MSLKIYNTLSRKKEEFTPINPPQVNMYVCGVTVYDECHLGHARALVNFDVIYRYLKAKNYQVNFVRNFTDIDDKIINKANQEGVDWQEITKRYIGTFHRDIQALGNENPTHEPKATENIDQIIKVVEGLIQKGFAYEKNGNVFYSVRKKEDYGKLSGKKIDELESGARIEVDDEKVDPLDFALWKSSKPDEPAWDSPWGKGRPGWHIECSAMSMHFLGETFDIHGGGRDLSFPHHENEIAQSEAYSGKLFAKYWVHNGFVNINTEKMSKSLGNFKTIDGVLKDFHPQTVRYFILSSHYRSPIDYTEQNMNNARKSLTRWYSALFRLKEQSSDSLDKIGKSEKKFLEQWKNLREQVEECMDDDFNTAKVFGLLFELARDLNRLLDSKTEIHSEVWIQVQEKINFVHSVLGLFGLEPSDYLNAERDRCLKSLGIEELTIQEQIQKRIEARKNKDWAMADQIRDHLQEKGIELRDKADGTVIWEVI